MPDTTQCAKSYTESNAWVTGKRGCLACLTITEWPHLILISSEAEHITIAMIKRWARKEWPTLPIEPATFGDGYVGVKITKRSGREMTYLPHRGGVLWVKKRP